jgi:GNAT superfamily N-acetyltransferase
MRASEFVSEVKGHDFMAGHCHVMALALKQLHPDWQIRAHVGYDDDAADDTEYRVDHVYTVAPDGTAYDCRGRFDNEQQLVGPDTTGGVDTQYVNFGPEEIKQAMLRGELKRFTKQDLANAMQVATQAGKQDVSEAPAGYKEIEFVCVNPQFPDATDPALQKKMYRGLKQIDGVVPLWQEWGDYSEGQASLSAIYQGSKSRDKILSLAKQLGVKVDLEQAVSDDYVDRAMRGEHEGQRGLAEGQDNLSYIGNCTDDDVIEHVFGDATGFAQAVEEYGDEFVLDDLVVKYDPETDVHSFYYQQQDVTEGSLTEIENMKQSHFRGGKDTLDRFSTPGKKHLRALPGGSGLMYSITYDSYVHILDPGIPGTTKPSIVAGLYLGKGVIPDSVQVGSITVDENYRGRGLARALYGIVLTIMKKTLISGDSQTPGGRRNWLSLASIPGVEIKGLLNLANSQLEKSRQVDNTIDQLMQLGGQFVAKNNNYTYWAFDVVPGNGQLAPAVKNKLSKLYGYDSDNLLMATWTGGQQGLAERKQSPLEDFEGLQFRMVNDNDQLFVNAFDSSGSNELGHVTFDIGDGKELDPQNLYVKHKFRSQGIARTMYDFVKSKGYKIQRSWDQTDAGAGFWDKHRGEEERVWEQDVAEGQVYEADASAVQFQTASTDNYQSSFTVTAIADGKNVGHFSFFRDPETDDVHNQAEVPDDVRGKGYGKALLLKAIEVANDHGLGFQEDSQSLSRAQSRVYDSLYDAGWIVDADGYWFLTPEGEQELARLSTIQQGVAENFADGRNPQDKGDAKRHGINTKASVSSLRKTAKQGGRKGQLAHWLANMKSGRAKKK